MIPLVSELVPPSSRSPARAPAAGASRLLPETLAASVLRKPRLEHLVQALRGAGQDRPEISGGVTCHVVQPARAARTAPWPEGVHPAVIRAFRRRGVELPWTHQAEATQAALAGRDVVVVTPTASGKSLCFIAPILTRCLQDPDARAILVFPTKALALDQAQAIHAIAQLAREEAGPGAPEIPVSTFDGDTPADVRRFVREKCRIVVTNPDMLHAAVLPHHARWATLFQGLSHVVLDELHAYKGVFGSHVSNVLRRLRRLAEFHGSSPAFITCSATIANPAEHAGALIGRDPALVGDDGAPRGERHVVLYNPPLLDPSSGWRQSALEASRRLTLLSLQGGFQTIVFATSRLDVELLTRYLKDDLRRMGKDDGLVEAYRGGHLPLQRRRTQERLREGSLRAVVATNALELGLDIGALDVAILAGWPGSIASAWQQMGRAGRRGRSSLCVLVARSAAIDQHVVTHPEHLLGASPEHARINGDNLLVLADHVKCAAFELPFRRGERFGGLDANETADLLTVFAEDGVLHEEGGAFHWTQETHPAEAVSLRSVSSDNFVVVDTSCAPPRVIAEVDFPSAPTTIHEKAIHWVAGKQFQVDRLDHEGRKAYVTPVDCDYYTDAISFRTVSVLDVAESRDAGEPGASATVRHGEVRICDKAIGFKKVKLRTSENLGYGDIALPEHELHSTAHWFTIDAPALSRLASAGISRREIVEGMTGAAHVLHAMGCILASCEPRDLGTAIGDARGSGDSAAWAAGAGLRGGMEIRAGARRAARDDDQDALLQSLDRFEPTLFLHDTVPGGVGLAPLLFERHEQLVTMGLQALRRCACDEGCPSCVGPRRGTRCRDVATRLLEEAQGRALDAISVADA